MAVVSAFTGPAIRTHVRLAHQLCESFDGLKSDDGRSDANRDRDTARRDSALKTSPSLTPLEVVETLLQSLSSGLFTDIEDAFAFVAPNIVEHNQMDATKFKQILETATFDGIVECVSWEIVDTPVSNDDTHLAVTLKVKPKPMPIGCTCFRCRQTGCASRTAS